ncbi:MAG: rhodanese-like domain-containing protein, partial [Thermomicrobiaceae bacterium]|nr:rhodanese-like domain-containing protein [Thermomicrobiaceae bacterium]
REPSEWQSGHIAGAQHVPFYRVAEDLRWLDPERPVAVICGSGERSVIAASLLRSLGLQRSASVRGGMDAWRAAGLPVERG